jgi:hypothetical protein
VKELRLQRISTAAAANAFMPTFIDDYNRRLLNQSINGWRLKRVIRELHRRRVQFGLRRGHWGWVEYGSLGEGVAGINGPVRAECRGCRRGRGTTIDGPNRALNL